MALVSQTPQALEPKPSATGFLGKTTLVNHQPKAGSIGKQTFSSASRVKTTPGKLGQSSKLAQSVSSLRRKGALS